MTAPIEDLQSTARQAGTRAREVGADAADQARAVSGEAKDRAASLAEAAQARVGQAAEARKEGLADRIEEVAHSVHRSGEQLEGQSDWVAGMIERGADELASLANTLRTNDLKSLIGGLEDLSRRQPALFVGASLAAGFALARVGRIAAASTSRADLPRAPALASVSSESGDAR